jgi:hypothetical protein
LNREIRLRFFFPTALCAWAFLTAGCVQPLGPGFRFTDRKTEIRASADSPDRLHIRVVDRLENSGNRTLRSLEVRIPEGPNFGTQNLRFMVDEKSVSLEPVSTSDRRMMQAEFDPPWEQRQSRAIATEWDLIPGPSARGTVAVSADSFYIADETALPLWQTPLGVFPRGGPTPDAEILRVIAPPDFRVLAPGKPLKSGADGKLAVRQFRLRPDVDYLPYVVAGRYEEQVIEAGEGALKGSVAFWTSRPLDAQAARTAGARLSSSVQAFTDFFGLLSTRKIIFHIVEAREDLPAEFAPSDDTGGTSFPEGALLDSRTIARGVAHEDVLQLAEYEFARTWFGWGVRPTPEAQILMGRGVGVFGLVIAADVRGPDQRRRMIASLLNRYDAARAVAADKALMEPPVGYSREERISTGYRAALFLVALEDLCGHDSLRAAFRDVIRARAGHEIGYEELRASLASISGRDLGEMFRNWLNRPGIPDDFRARYVSASTAQVLTPGVNSQR